MNSKPRTWKIKCNDLWNFIWEMHPRWRSSIHIKQDTLNVYLGVIILYMRNYTKYRFEEIKIEINEDCTLILPNKNGIPVEVSNIDDYDGDWDIKAEQEYVKVRSENGIITEIYKTLDGTNYNWYPITEEDF